MKKVFLVALVVSFLAGTGAWAELGTRTPNINKRERHQMRRIHQGVKSGQLTKDEAKDLRKDEREIRQMKREAKSDGTVTVQERKDIQQKLNDESKKIYEEKHDAETR